VTATNATQEFNGTTWTAGGNLPVAKWINAGAGTQTAGLSFAGIASGTVSTYLTSTEEYDGTSWTAGGNLATGRLGPGGAGTQTSALAFGGDTGVVTNVTEEYDGTSWTSGGNLTTARNTPASAGTQTSALAAGGVGPTDVTNSTEEFTGGPVVATRTVTGT
jgi:hypothetical protein